MMVRNAEILRRSLIRVNRKPRRSRFLNTTQACLGYLLSEWASCKFGVGANQTNMMQCSYFSFY